MLYQIYALTVKDLKVVLHDRGAWLNLFAIPIVFILIMSAAGVGGVRASSNTIEVLIVNRDTGDLAGKTVAELRKVDGLKLVETLDGVSITRDAAEKRVMAGAYPVAVIFPPDFTSRILAAATDA
jgi:ABC-type Na+ efflux pump permease subunit